MHGHPITLCHIWCLGKQGENSSINCKTYLSIRCKLQSHLCNLVRPIEVKNLPMSLKLHKNTWLNKKTWLGRSRCVTWSLQTVAEMPTSTDMKSEGSFSFAPPTFIPSSTQPPNKSNKKSNPPPHTHTHTPHTHTPHTHIFAVDLNPNRQCSCCDNNDKRIFGWTMYENVATCCNTNMKTNWRSFKSGENLEVKS